MARRTWFKHFTNASEGSLRVLIQNRQQESVFLYWLILELLAKFETDDKPGRLSLSWRFLSKEAGYLIPKLRKTYSNLIQNSLIRDLSQNEMGFELEVPKWLELQNTWSKVRKEHSTNSPGEVRSKKLEVRSKNKTIDQSVDRSRHDLEIVYQGYPRKQGKQRGMKTAYSQVKTDQDYTDLQTAVANYAAYCRREISEPRYIKQFSTFMSEWRDWVNPEVGLAGPTPSEIEKNKLRRQEAEERANRVVDELL